MNVCSSTGLEKARVPRPRKQPVRYEYDSSKISSTHVDASVYDKYKREYFAALDITISTITDRFNQAGTVTYSSMVNIIRQTIKGEPVIIPQNLIDTYDEIDWESLKTELAIISSLLKEVECKSPKPSSLIDFASWLKNSTSRALLSQTELLLTLILVLPASNAVSERTFSSLKRVKTYLRSTMGQYRLNSCLILHTYKELTDQIDTEEIIKEFVSGRTDRLKRIAVL